MMIKTGEYLDAGIKLKELRTNKKLSIYKTARRLNISGNYLSMIERGMYCPSDQVIFNIAEYYEIPPEIIFKWYNKMLPPSNELLIKMPSLKKIITELSIDPRLTDSEKDDIAKQIYNIANSLRRS